MPKVSMPKSNFLGVEDWKEVLKKAKSPIEKELVFIEASNSEQLECKVYNKLLGEKRLCEYKSKFRAFFDAYTMNTDEWVGQKIEPVLPSKESNFFARFIVPDLAVENIE